MTLSGPVFCGSPGSSATVSVDQVQHLSGTEDLRPKTFWLFEAGPSPASQRYILAASAMLTPTDPDDAIASSAEQNSLRPYLDGGCKSKLISLDE